MLDQPTVKYDRPRVADFLCEVGDADALDRTLTQMPGCARVVAGTWDAAKRQCRVRVFGDPAFFKYAMAQQGYGRVIGEVPLL